MKKMYIVNKIWKNYKEINYINIKSIINTLFINILKDVNYTY